MSAAVLSSTGRKLMQTSDYRARKLFKSHHATIECYRPIFTIRLTHRKEGETQPIEYACDTRYQHAGVSIKSEKHKFMHAQYDMLSDETERHNGCRRYRRTRRNHKRYRIERFDSRSKKNKEMALSLRHRKENQIRLSDSFCKVIPITSATFEMGKSDSRLLQAIAGGVPLPEGKDYQRGIKIPVSEGTGICPQQRSLHLPGMREIRQRRCDSAYTSHQILEELPFRSNQQLTDSMRILPHGEESSAGRKALGLEPKSIDLAGAAYMSAVRWAMYRELVLNCPEIDIHIQYGAKTAMTSKLLHLS